MLQTGILYQHTLVPGTLSKRSRSFGSSCLHMTAMLHHQTNDSFMKKILRAAQKRPPMYYLDIIENFFRLFLNNIKNAA